MRSSSLLNAFVTRDGAAAVTSDKIAACAVSKTKLADGAGTSQGLLGDQHTPVVNSGSLTLDLETGNVLEVNLTENVTGFGLANPPASGRAGSAMVVLKKHTTGGRTLAWPSPVRWSGGTPPLVIPAANAVDIYAFVTRNGGATGYGFPGGQNFS
jgi:hypothetical protein